MARGAYNSWWYQPDTFCALIPADITYRTDALELRGELAAALLSGALCGGLALRAAWLSRHAQTSVEPFVDVRLGRAFLGLGVNVVLNYPLGVLDGESTNGWGARLSGGAAF